MNKIIVSGIGTDVGKTVASAILTTLFKADYWKPVESGIDHSDTKEIKRLIERAKHTIYPPAYSLKAPLSPHHAARLENTVIDTESIRLPKTPNFLVIEMAGGIFVPLNMNTLSIDLFKSWEAKWVLVSKLYLGNINHTLLTIEALKKRSIDLLGIIFNGEPNPDSEKAILNFSNVPFLGRILPEKVINTSTIKRYANQWQQSGTLLHK